MNIYREQGYIFSDKTKIFPIPGVKILPKFSRLNKNKKIAICDATRRVRRVPLSPFKEIGLYITSIPMPH